MRMTRVTPPSDLKATKATVGKVQHPLLDVLIGGPVPASLDQGVHRDASMSVSRACIEMGALGGPWLAVDVLHPVSDLVPHESVDPAAVHLGHPVEAQEHQAQVRLGLEIVDAIRPSAGVAAIEAPSRSISNSEQVAIRILRGTDGGAIQNDGHRSSVHVIAPAR